MRSLRDIFARLGSANGDVRAALRSFNMMHNQQGKAQSVKGLAEKIGLHVDREPLSSGVSGYLERDAFSASGYRIVINSRNTIERQRWAVLHEIGHYLLHRRDDDIFQVEYLDRSSSAFYEDPVKEREADEFAAVLLFGDGALEAAVSLLNGDMSRLAKSFGVTERVVEIAMRQFLISGRK